MIGRSPTDTDPRSYMERDSLEDANRLALPKVAGAGDGPHLAIGLAIAVGLGALTFSQMSSARLKLTEPPAVVEAPIEVAAVAPSLPAPPRPEPAPFVAGPDLEGETIQPERLRAPGLVVDYSAADEKGETTAAIAAGTTVSEQFAARARLAEEPPATATQVENLAAVVLEGTMIVGVLETALNSDLPGYVRAVVSEPVRSFDGARVLVPRGSRLIGQYRSGLAVGESRAFVIWTRLILPDGVSIRIGSPATDTLGRAGLSGNVDRHFLQRFGSAILLSVIGAGLDYAAAAAGDGGDRVIVGSTSDAYAIAQAALQNNMNIPPTVKVPQGAPIRIFVARDLYFPDAAQSSAVGPGASP